MKVQQLVVVDARLQFIASWCGNSRWVAGYSRIVTNAGSLAPDIRVVVLALGSGNGQ